MKKDKLNQNSSVRITLICHSYPSPFLKALTCLLTTTCMTVCPVLNWRCNHT